MKRLERRMALYRQAANNVGGVWMGDPTPPHTVTELQATDIYVHKEDSVSVGNPRTKFLEDGPIKAFRAPAFRHGADKNGFSLGFSKNLRQVFGDEKKYWFLPVFTSLLPPQFPQDKPSVSVFPPVRHHLIDSCGGSMVISPLINNFSMHSDLGKIIQSILDEFWKNPPVLANASPGLPFVYNNPSGIPPFSSPGFHFVPTFPLQDLSRPVTPASVQVPAPDSVPSPANTSRSTTSNLITDTLSVPTADMQTGLNGYAYKMPEIPDSFPDLSNLSLNQLKEMSDQEDILLEHFVNLPQLKQITSDKEELVNSIIDMAKKNLQLEPQLDGRRQDILYKAPGRRLAVATGPYRAGLQSPVPEAPCLTMTDAPTLSGGGTRPPPVLQAPAGLLPGPAAARDKPASGRRLAVTTGPYREGLPCPQPVAPTEPGRTPRSGGGTRSNQQLSDKV
ncbi:VP37A protein, partial [Polypterus senegalus]